MEAQACAALSVDSLATDHAVPEFSFLSLNGTRVVTAAVVRQGQDYDHTMGIGHIIYFHHILQNLKLITSTISEKKVKL